MNIVVIILKIVMKIALLAYMHVVLCLFFWELSETTWSKQLGVKEAEKNHTTRETTYKTKVRASVVRFLQHLCLPQCI